MLRFRALGLIFLLVLGEVGFDASVEAATPSTGCGPAPNEEPEVDVGRAQALRHADLRPAHGSWIVRSEPVSAALPWKCRPAPDVPARVEPQILEALLAFLVALRAP